MKRKAKKEVAEEATDEAAEADEAAEKDEEAEQDEKEPHGTS